MEKSDYVIVYISSEDGQTTESRLFRVEEDGTFLANILLPTKIGNYTFIVASGKGFDTDKYAKISLIDPEALSYPSLPLEKRKFVPRINNIESIPSVTLPDNLSAELLLRQGDVLYAVKGKALLFADT